MIFPPLPKRYHWHNWFAWHPIWVDGYFVWLEDVNRIYNGTSYEYYVAKIERAEDDSQ